MAFAQRMQEIAPFHVMELMARAKAMESAGRRIIHLEVGEPGFPTAEPIVEAGRRFLAGGHVHYTPALGLPALRERIAAFYGERYGFEVPARRVVITAGASGALLLALGALVSPGDEWLLPDPGYPCNRHFVRFTEGRPVALPVGPDTRYQPTADMITAAWTAKTRGLLVASPSNPTGTTLSADELDGLWRSVSARGGELIVDEIYHGLVFDGGASTAASIADDIFIVNSFSKYFGMTGWRLGWVVLPERHLRNIEKLAQNLFICPSAVAQHAALAAFDPDSMVIHEARREAFRRRRDVLVPGLARLGFDVPVIPDGAFYAYAGCAQLADDSYALADRLLAGAGVAATPGIDFGENLPAQHMRFSFTVGQDDIEEGLSRMRSVLQPG